MYKINITRYQSDPLFSILGYAVDLPRVGEPFLVIGRPYPDGKIPEIRTSVVEDIEEVNGLRRLHTRYGLYDVEILE